TTLLPARDSALNSCISRTSGAECIAGQICFSISTFKINPYNARKRIQNEQKICSKVVYRRLPWKESDTPYLFEILYEDVETNASPVTLMLHTQFAAYFADGTFCVERNRLYCLQPFLTSRPGDPLYVAVPILNLIPLSSCKETMHILSRSYQKAKKPVPGDYSYYLHAHQLVLYHPRTNEEDQIPNEQKSNGDSQQLPKR
ncbi:hypothetical protein SDJN02_07060, partial [Cucurbita argyrosperma subsp. argyrosperma]